MHGTRPRRVISICRLIPIRAIRVTRVILETSSPIITMAIPGFSSLPLTPIHDPVSEDNKRRPERYYNRWPAFFTFSMFLLPIHFFHSDQCKFRSTGVPIPLTAA